MPSPPKVLKKKQEIINGGDMAGDFSRNVKINALLWCDRHCCLCGKARGSNIEVHHIVSLEQGGSDDIDNAIPLCFDCHKEVGSYNKGHPLGSKYRAEELKARREQIYEEYTRHLVPLISYEVTQELTDLPNGPKRKFPDVGFNVRHRGDSLPVRVKIILDILLGGRSLGPPDREYYSGDKLWHLNPRFEHRGHFKIPEKVASSTERLEVRVTAVVIDQYDREHELLPVGFVYMRKENAWYFEP